MKCVAGRFSTHLNIFKGITAIKSAKSPSGHLPIGGGTLWTRFFTKIAGWVGWKLKKKHLCSISCQFIKNVVNIFTLFCIFVASITYRCRTWSANWRFPERSCCSLRPTSLPMNLLKRWHCPCWQASSSLTEAIQRIRTRLDGDGIGGDRSRKYTLLADQHGRRRCPGVRSDNARTGGVGDRFTTVFRHSHRRRLVEPVSIGRSSPAGYARYWRHFAIGAPATLQKKCENCNTFALDWTQSD